MVLEGAIAVGVGAVDGIRMIIVVAVVVSFMWMAEMCLFWAERSRWSSNGIRSSSSRMVDVKHSYLTWPCARCNRSAKLIALF